MADSAIKLTPRALCGKRWPHGPFRLDGLDGDHVAAAATAQFAASVSRARGLRGWTRGALATRSGVSATTVGRIESGDTWPDLRSMGRISAALELPLIVAAERAGTGGTDGQRRETDEVPDPALWLNLGAQPDRVLRPAQVIDALLWHDSALAREVMAYQAARRERQGTRPRPSGPAGR